MTFTEKYSSSKWIEYLLLAWFITLPFGSHVFPVSIGFMTLYPNLIFGLILLIPSMRSIFTWTGIEKLFAVFLLIWLITAGIQSFVTHSFHSNAIFDLRSLGMQFIACIVIFGSRNILKNEVFLRTVRTGILIYTAILFVSGIIEWLTGCHFSGLSTDKLQALSPSNTMMHAPMFVFDNVNDFLLHIMVFFLLSLILIPELRNNKFIPVSGWIIIYVFAVYSQSKFALIIAGSVLILIALYAVVEFLRKKRLRTFIPFAIAGLLLVILVYSKPVFLGPAYKNSADYRINDVQLLEKKDGHYVVKPAGEFLTAAEKKQVIRDIDSSIVNDPFGSQNVRKNLILNGFTFTKSHPVLGVGAGNYRTLTHSRKDLLYTGTVDSAHFFPVEIISQYGIMGWLYFIFVIVVFIQLLRNGFLQLNKLNWLLVFFIFLPLFWNVPSSFLYLDLNHLLLPLLISVLSMYTFLSDMNTEQI